MAECELPLLLAFPTLEKGLKKWGLRFTDGFWMIATRFRGQGLSAKRHPTNLKHTDLFLPFVLVHESLLYLKSAEICHTDYSRKTMRRK